MVDYRVKTFITLYETMNYRITAERLNMSQPAVTQHIQMLEREYGCKFFIYDMRKLSCTPQAHKFAVYCRGLLYNDKEFRADISRTVPRTLRVGATKTIGEFVLTGAVEKYLRHNDRSLKLLVDNTEKLLRELESGELDFALVEGNFDKSKYASQTFRMEPFVGICAKGNPFAGRAVALEEVLSSTLILREEGSGTRDVLEHLLGDFGYTVSNFARTVCISNFRLLCHLIEKNIGISFVYQAVADADNAVATFTIKDLTIIHEFCYVYLKNTDAHHLISQFED